MGGALEKQSVVDNIYWALSGECITVEPEGTFQMMMIDGRMKFVCDHLAPLSAKNRGHRKTRTNCN